MCTSACTWALSQVHFHAGPQWPVSKFGLLPQNDLSNRVRPDSGIRTAAILLADDDLLLP